MRRLAVFTSEVDEARDATSRRRAVHRTGPRSPRGQLQDPRHAPDHPAPTAIPASPLTLTLPQQVTGWPRTVLTIAKNADDPTIAPTALVLVQESPRENYQVLYSMALAPDADVPEVAPASIGAAPISPEFKGLVMPTGQVAAAYADVLLKGDESEFAAAFDPEGDLLREQLGVAGQKAIRDALKAESPTADIAFSNAVGDSPTIALATNDAGALVTVSITQTEKVTPNDGGTIGFQEGAPGAALSGFTGEERQGRAARDRHPAALLRARRRNRRREPTDPVARLVREPHRSIGGPMTNAIPPSGSALRGAVDLSALVQRQQQGAQPEHGAHSVGGAWRPDRLRDRRRGLRPHPRTLSHRSGRRGAVGVVERAVEDPARLARATSSVRAKVSSCWPPRTPTAARSSCRRSRRSRSPRSWRSSPASPCRSSRACSPTT